MYKKSRTGSLPRMSFQADVRNGAKGLRPPVLKTDKAAAKMLEQINRLLRNPSVSTNPRDRV